MDIYKDPESIITTAKIRPLLIDQVGTKMASNPETKAYVRDLCVKFWARGTVQTGTEVKALVTKIVNIGGRHIVIGLSSTYQCSLLGRQIGLIQTPFLHHLYAFIFLYMRLEPHNEYCCMERSYVERIFHQGWSLCDGATSRTPTKIIFNFISVLCYVFYL